MADYVEKCLRNSNIEPNLFLNWLETKVLKTENETRTILNEILSTPYKDYSALDQSKSIELLQNTAILEALEISKKILTRPMEGRNIQDLNNSSVEAIIWTYNRPALLVLGGQIQEPDSPIWQMMSERKDEINETISSVGRIELEGHPRIANLGTGFLVGDDIIMTNRHVVEPSGTDNILFLPGVKPYIDYKGYALPQGEEEEYDDKKIIDVHRLYDLALLKISKTDGTRKPLSIAGHEPPILPNIDVYVCGYPQEPRAIEMQVANIIFGGLFGVKRVQPGKCCGFVTHTDTNGTNLQVLAHDCSTLKGNSGSPLIDLHNNTVIGLHFFGTFRERNVAVPLWKLRNDPMLANNGVQFID
jgi:V8-like Glu-specific endopeptidase